MCRFGNTLQTVNRPKDEGLKIKVKSFTDPVALNRATASGEIDVNAFQSWSYLQAYNKENKKAQLAAIGTTYLEPMGLYSDKYKSVKDIPDGATVAIANNPANTARGLLLLQSAGLIKLKPGLEQPVEPMRWRLIQRTFNLRN